MKCIVPKQGKDMRVYIDQSLKLRKSGFFNPVGDLIVILWLSTNNYKPFSSNIFLFVITLEGVRSYNNQKTTVLIKITIAGTIAA